MIGPFYCARGSESTSDVLAHLRHAARIEVYIVQAGHLTMARMKAGLAGHDGTFQEGHTLDAKTAQKIPAKMIGKPLSRNEAATLLKRFGS